MKDSAMIPKTRGTLLRRVSKATAIVTVAAVVGGIVGLQGVPAAIAATPEGGSAVTVKWAGGNDAELQKFQVDHAKLLSDGAGNDNGSGHWDDFKNVQVSVSKTKNLGEEAVKVSVSGMAPTDTQYTGLKSNFLQVFQCWGPDPLAANFAETCQYGGWNLEALGKSTAADAMAAVVGSAASSRGAYSRVSVPFRTPTGQVSKPTEVNAGGSQFTANGVASFFDPTTTNEQPYVRVDGDGTGSTTFAVQTAASQPYLGCGNAQLAGSRCWLVVVPRGIHSGAWPSAPAADCLPSMYGHPYGQKEFAQHGSPLTPSCSYFQDRIVVPLDFADPTGGCAPGSPETRVVGSELLAGAMSSWQRGLCSSTGTAYNLATNSGDVTRGQLLTGRTDMAVVAQPFTASTIGSTSIDLLADADLGYAPVANAAFTISYVAQSPDKTYRDLKLTPRLLAKLLTQSYLGDVPRSSSGDVSEGDALINSYWPNRSYSLASGGGVGDPDWFALGNPPMDAASNGTFVVSGPQGEDVTTQLWRYIQSDADAVAFLRGEPDPWGNTINPYYLPSTNPTARGGGLPFDLSSTPIDVFLKADQTLSPSKKVADANMRGLQIDSVTASPYSSSLVSNAARIQKADTRFTNRWEALKPVGAALGAWDPELPQIGSSGKFTIGPTDAAAADLYAIDSARLALPVSTRTGKEDIANTRTFVGPTDEAMSSALSAMKTDPDTGFAQTDFSALPPTAYPLTTTLYAAVDLSAGRDEAERDGLADFVEYTSGQGNVRGLAPGQLPAGYVPLTDAQTAAARRVADAIRHPAVDPESAVPGSTSSGSPKASAAAVVPAAVPASATKTSQAAVDASGATPAASTSAQAVLGGALVAGIVGMIASPFLLRRRGGTT